MAKVDHERQRYPHSIVWTPIPCLTWLFPFIGHMGIATTEGVIRDFAGPYYVSQDNMAFGAPTKYWTLDPSRANGNQWWGWRLDLKWYLFRWILGLRQSCGRGQ